MPVVISSYTAQLSSLDPQQRNNVCLAARKINGTYIKPEMQFSFNEIVGPRTVQNGFAVAKTYLEGNIVNSEGGGICFLSSAIYNAALKANLKIIKRVAHTRPISSFPLGLDATVWYGINDLKLKNNTGRKIRIDSKCSYNNLNIAIKGYSKPNKINIIIKKYKISSKKIRVIVNRKLNKSLEKISDDIYYND